jgi:hypothetical protein
MRTRSARDRDPVEADVAPLATGRGRGGDPQADLDLVTRVAATNAAVEVGVTENR